jgi:hypothetical protein
MQSIAVSMIGMISSTSAHCHAYALTTRPRQLRVELIRSKMVHAGKQSIGLSTISDRQSG